MFWTGGESFQTQWGTGLSVEENFGGGSVAEAAAWAIVEKVLSLAHVLRGDCAEVDPFGIKLS